MVRCYGLRDDQWERIAGVLPRREETVSVTAKDNRLSVEAVIDRSRAGIPGRDVPERFEGWNTIARRHKRWLDGTSGNGCSSIWPKTPTTNRP